VEEQKDIGWEDVGCVGVTRPALEPHGVIAEEAKWLGSAGAVKRYSKNNFMRHPTPRTMCPIHSSGDPCTPDSEHSRRESIPSPPDVAMPREQA
jgi:hypothetical protein